MSRFGLIGGSYTSQSRNADAEQTVNWYVESIEGQGSASAVLYPTPGLKSFVSVNETPERGEITIQGRTFAVIGGTFYEVLANGTTVMRGIVANDGLRSIMTAGPTQVFFASGGIGYVFDLVANTFTALAESTFNGSKISFVGYCDGFFLALYANSNEFQVSGLLDATSWDLSQVAKVSRFPDNVLAMLVDHDVVWMWGGYQSVVYYDSGNIFPFDVIPGAFIEQGIAAPYSACKLDNSVVWLGGDPRGQGIAWRANGYTPQRISNHAVEFAWQGYIRQYGTIADAVAYSYQDQGHSFWVIYFPSANKTWVFDAATSLWHERGYWNLGNGTYTAHRSWGHTFNFGKHLVGDPFSGTMYDMNIALYDDDGNPLRRLRRAAPISSEEQWIFHHQLQIDVETGLGPQPPLTTSPGPAVGPTQYVLQDSNGIGWLFQINDTALVVTKNNGPFAGTPDVLILNDSNFVSWQLGITTLGQVTTTSIAAGSNPSVIEMTTYQSSLQALMSIDTMGRLITQIDNTPSPRAPQLMLRWSDDAGHTWSNERTLQCGQAGDYRARAMAWRLGRSRDRVYEVSATDPVPWRLIDAYIIATPGFTSPTERIVKQYAKAT